MQRFIMVPSKVVFVEAPFKWLTKESDAKRIEDFFKVIAICNRGYVEALIWLDTG